MFISMLFIALFLGSYGPTYHTCPSNVSFLRPATNLNPAESAWVSERKSVVLSSLSSYLSRLDLHDFPLERYLSSLSHNSAYIPTLSLAISGGAAPATWTGMGVMQALDDRFPPSVAQKTGGLLQSLTYIAGLSGGSFPVISYAVSDFPTTADIVIQYDPMVNPLSPTGASGEALYDEEVFLEIGEKLQAGFPVSLADFLARVYSYEFIPGPGAGINTTWSGVTQLPRFENHTMPLPILEFVIVSSDAPAFYVGDVPILIPQANSTLVEVSPFEWGSWQGPRTGFTPTKYLGTVLLNGQPVNTSRCVNGFDNAGFMLATASCAWNLWYVIDATNGTGPNFAKRGLVLSSRDAYVPPVGKRSLLSAAPEAHALSKRKTIFFPEAEFDLLLSAYNTSFNATIPSILTAPYPNPFFGINNDSEPYLSVVDGSESGQTIPLAGVMQPVRKPDFIIAYDVSQETTYGWQNGTNLIDSALWAKGFDIPFPKIASATTMLNRGYTLRPTLFGCKNASVPLLLYLNNAPYSAYTNFSIIDNQLDPPQVTDILTNSFNIVTQGNGTLGKDWAECLGCAAIQRSVERLGWKTTPQCEQCFAEYCWNEVFNPSLLLEPRLSFAAWNQTHQYFYTNGTV
ncbi:FabD/lysophospholipase-like protein [Dacryopinax primogenitus]|uniref:Lysophospholipase n=1 Tax=Dacryopinax primogenitus (strain DJM 731) TaxID=1858805 RepID=M5FVI6_DACPD|nr:FabD/lysophospholipase-like protein [Dacryopinax primogenitus]EJT97346.1 FabD/lysophospholipase-like protein [Dacryopinax primogenitus]